MSKAEEAEDENEDCKVTDKNENSKRTNEGKDSDEGEDDKNTIEGVKEVLIPLNEKQDLSRKAPPPLNVKVQLNNRRKAERSEKMSVTFDRIILREYPICLGNNPAVSRGPPLTIDWEPMTHLEFDFGQFHDLKLPSRGQAEMFLPNSIREKILKEAGYSRREVLRMVKDVNVSRLKRKKTIANLKFQRFEYGIENMRRRFKGILSKEKNLQWEPESINSSGVEVNFSEEKMTESEIGSSIEGDNIDGEARL